MNNLSFTFGIVTDGYNDHYIKETIKSIEENNIPEYEIIIVGNSSIKPTNNINIYKFDESIIKGWTTRKKNIIIENAKYDILVIMHDYIKLNNNWYEGFLKYGDNFDWCINPIVNTNGIRYRDYTLFPHTVDSSQYRIEQSPFVFDFLHATYSPGDIDYYFYNNCLLPYDFENNININKYMYISGAYFIIKREIALKHKLDETLSHGRGEDLEYSKRLHYYGHIIKCNPYSYVTLQKYKEPTYWEKEISEDKLTILKNLS